MSKRTYARIASGCSASSRNSVSLVSNPDSSNQWKNCARGTMPPTRLRSLLFPRFQQFIKHLFQLHPSPRRLQLLEIQQLGEKRFVAVVRVDQQKFLIGGGASVSLLAEIDPQGPQVLARRPAAQEQR